jgi:hypothetical protein
MLSGNRIGGRVVIEARQRSQPLSHHFANHIISYQLLQQSVVRISSLLNALPHIVCCRLSLRIAQVLHLVRRHQASLHATA